MNKYVKTAFEIFILILIIFTTAFGYMRYIEPYTLKEVEISMSGSPTELKIAVFSDTHFNNWYTPEDFEDVAEKINAQSVDLVFFVGDLIDHLDEYNGDLDSISNALSKLDASLGKYAVYGNHDYGGGAEWEYEGLMEAAGFTVLVNEEVILEDLGIAITGIDDTLIGEGTAEAASATSDDYYNIVLCHEPDIVDDILGYPVNLMISGHTHGGQINFPGITKRRLPPDGQKYVKGIFEFENDSNTQLYVSKGIGMTKLPLRFMAMPEVTFITLTN